MEKNTGHQKGIIRKTFEDDTEGSGESKIAVMIARNTSSSVNGAMTKFLITDKKSYAASKLPMFDKKECQ
jgi:hypothetical protein